MGISLKVIIYFMTASVSLLSVTGNKGGPVNITCDNTPVNKTAHLGGSVTIDCKYPRAEDGNIRYFCREDENFHCTSLISTYTNQHTKLDRLSLTDDKQQGVYTVILFTLTQGDAGRYQCAMKSPIDSSTTCLSEIHLHILNWDDIASMAINHGTGENVQIKCHYSDIHTNNEKFLCKGENPFNCEELIHTTEQDRDVVKGRFNIRDNRRRKYFYVYIHNVSTADSGTYWCGSNRTWQHAEYTKILLSVAERHIKTKISGHPAPKATTTPELRSKSSTTMQKHEPPNIGMIAGVVVCLALLLILVVVLILCRHKLPRIRVCCASLEQRTNTGHNTEGNHGDPHYKEIQMPNQQASSGDALPSIYATVNSPADQLHYASVSFQKDSVSFTADVNVLPDTSKNGSSACDYSSISRTQGATYPPAAEQTLYSTVTKPGEP